MVDVPGIPGFRIEKKLGEGGMAAVFLGVEEKLHRKVAIKILDPAMLKHKVFELRFLHEAETAASMDHSNIISIYDIGRVGDYCYIVMEYLKESLKEHLLTFPGFKLKPKLAWDILKPITEALDYAHSRKIIHRDIKPDNIMFREDDTPVLTDFGIARALDSQIQMTRSGVSVGTPYYMSPEQCTAEQLDGRSDIYSLGVVLFEILTGYKPYEADSPMVVALKHVRNPVPQLPEELSPYQPLIDKMMAKRKEDRAASCEELLELMNSVFQPARRSTLLFPVIPDTEPIKFPPPAPALQPPPDTLPESLDELELTSAPVMVSESALSITKTIVPLQGKYPVKKLVEIAALGLLLVVVFIIFYNLVSKETIQEGEINSPGQRDTSAKVVLRSRYKTLGFANAAAMIREKNFFENALNKTGAFKNEYKKQLIKGDAVVMDTTADLMWYAGNPPKTANFKKAEKWVKSLNTREYVGYMGWRLPSLEEAVSLLRKGKNAAGLYIDPAFSGHLRSIWTGDLQRTQTYWVVRFYQGIVFADSEHSSHFVLAVRSIK